MMDLLFWAVVGTFLGLRVYYHYENKRGNEEWNRRNMEMESL